MRLQTRLLDSNRFALTCRSRTPLLQPMPHWFFREHGRVQSLRLLPKDARRVLHKNLLQARHAAVSCALTSTLRLSCPQRGTIVPGAGVQGGL